MFGGHRFDIGNASLWVILSESFIERQKTTYQSVGTNSKKPLPLSIKFSDEFCFMALEWNESPVCACSAQI
jgi:hypothetical protein